VTLRHFVEEIRSSGASRFGIFEPVRSPLRMLMVPNLESQMHLVPGCIDHESFRNMPWFHSLNMAIPVRLIVLNSSV
jgi:hypothetical protein